MNEKKNILVVCPSLERLDLVQQMAKSFWEVTSPYPDMVVVAQGPDDGTSGWCRANGIEVIESPQPLSFSVAINMAAKAMTHDWLLLANNDLIFQAPFWEGAEAMMALGYEIIGAKLLYPDRRIQHFGKWFTLDFYPFHVLRWQPETHPMAQQPRQFPNVTFSCVLIKSEVWRGIGGLSEEYQNGFEDDDFCLAAREQGAQIGVHPDMLAIHLEAQTTGHDTANKEVQWAKFHKKWVETGRIQWPLGIYQGWRNP